MIPDYKKCISYGTGHCTQECIPECFLEKENLTKGEVIRMTIKEFAVKLASKEGGKEQVNIAQIMDILKAINSMFPGDLFYTLIKWLKK